MIRRFVLVAFFFLATSALAAPPRSVVIWISIDGMRPDYVEKSNAPFLKRMMKEGAYTRQLIPIFPSLTFPSHSAEITGVRVDQHGIPANKFFDSSTRKTFEYPDDASLLQSEPLWITATRQGIRTAVGAWPVSYDQQGPIKAAYFDTKFESKISDAERLTKLLETWKSDHDPQPLRLLLGYTHAPDTLAHRYGPDSPLTLDGVKETDAALSDFFTQAQALFKERMAPDDRLFLILSTDHGMAKVTTLVNLQKMTGKPWPEEIKALESSTMAHFFIDPSAGPAHKKELEQDLLDSLQHKDYLTAYRKADLPAKWHYTHPTRIGDVVLLLKPGYAFNARLPLETFTPEKAGGPFGMHGYDPQTCPDMLGLTIIWRSGKPLSGQDLGPIDSLRLLPTACQFLSITPPPNAKADPIPHLAD